MYYVYWNRGSCNDGDHDSGLESFDSLQDALVKIAEVQSWNFYPRHGDCVQLIEGVELEPDGSGANGVG